MFNPEQFGAFVAWLAIYRGPLSALVHPNTGDDLRDHSAGAIWMGDKLELNLDSMRRFLALKAAGQLPEAIAATLK